MHALRATTVCVTLVVAILCRYTYTVRTYIAVRNAAPGTHVLL
jgi:hypothetical protein